MWVAERLYELVSIAKSGGIICFIVNKGVFSTSGVDTKIKELESSKFLSVLEIQENDYMTKKDVKGLNCVVKVT